MDTGPTSGDRNRGAGGHRVNFGQTRVFPALAGPPAETTIEFVPLGRRRLQSRLLWHGGRFSHSAIRRRTLLDLLCAAIACSRLLPVVTIERSSFVRINTAVVENGGPVAEIVFPMH